jgi:hypothetical protein
LRAAQRLRKRPGYEDLHPWEGENLGGTLVWFNRANVISYAMAAQKADCLNHYRDRNPNVWWTKASEQDLRAKLRHGGEHYKRVRPGGGWYGHVQEWIRERDLRRAGASKRLKKFLAAKKRGLKRGPQRSWQNWRGVCRVDEPPAAQTQTSR